MLGITKPIHLRGLHYALVSSTSLTKPNGTRYLNNADDWEWLQVEASKAARWLGYVPFDRIVDERNVPPVIVVHGNGAPEVEIGLGATIEVSVPELEDIKPTVYLATSRRPAEVSLVVFGKKTSLADVAKPLCPVRRRTNIGRPSSAPVFAISQAWLSVISPLGR